jgi:pSer/pThr/pTyr-binding forkhead associated (FHA) protein
MKLSLMVMTAGKAEGQTIPVTLAQFIIGRDPECNLRPASAMISKRHCALLVRGGQVFLRDFDSTNGTFVNEEPVKGEVPLKNDDVLKVGPLSFKVVIQGQPAPIKPTPPPPPARPKVAEAAPDDESAAALLLSIEDGEASFSESADNGESVPGGSTVMDIPAFLSPAQEQKAAAEAKKDADKAAAQKKIGSAQSAAQSILDKYRKGGQRK